jgi:S-adenosylmethionine:tRNA ribosyltransferase-isomerase
MISKSSLQLSDFDYNLPDELIAQRPPEKRADSRLMRLDRKDSSIRHQRFIDLPELLKDGDLLVVNDTRVFPARLKAKRDTGGIVEMLLLRFPKEGDETPCLLRPGRRIRDGEMLRLENGGELLVRRGMNGFTVSGIGMDLKEAVYRFGKVPLPPYIVRGSRGPDPSDSERYQTVYANLPGAVAAPTAGLHFDENLFDRISERGTRVARVTLHVGPGTFQPVRTADIRSHHMGAETYHIPPETAELIRKTRKAGRRVVAVGTTVVRTLETAFNGRILREGEGTSSLFIYPGYRFSVVDALVTNFHLPRSTLLMLVCAFAGTEQVLEAYRAAVREKYRFYSYGDAMFIE